MNKLNSLNVLTLAVVATFLTTATFATQQQARADECSTQPIVGELLCGARNTINNADQGFSDGNRAGINDESSSCPSSDGTYCAGWATGYANGASDRKNFQENQHGDDGEFQESD